jgi:predicted nucleic acid-binding protein
MPGRLHQAMLDTSVVIDLDSISADVLPERVAISAVTMAELAAFAGLDDLIEIIEI